jgi:hypothetical protein
VSNFEQVNFTINEKYFEKSLRQCKLLCFTCDLFNCSYKNIVLRNVHSLGWILWLCFYLCLCWLHMHLSHEQFDLNIYSTCQCQKCQRCPFDTRKFIEHAYVDLHMYKLLNAQIVHMSIWFSFHVLSTCVHKMSNEHQFCIFSQLFSQRE